MDSCIRNSKAYHSFYSALKPYIKSYKAIALGYSGGQDSELMAACLSAFAKVYPNIRCVLLHVNHGMSPNALMWEKHCAMRSQAYGLDIEFAHLKITPKSRKSLEALAREGRYEFFKSHLPEQSILLTAHHADDQLETILLALKRGSGSKGLSGIHKQGQLTANQVCLRPFLELSRQEIETEVARLRLPFIDDESNEDISFDRNFLRQQVIPSLKQRWPGLERTARRTASLLQQEQEVLSTLLASKLAQLEVAPNVFYLPDLLSLSFPLQGSLIRHILTRAHIKPPSMARLQEIIKQVTHVKQDSRVHIELGHMVMKRYQSHLYLVNSLSVQPSKNLTILGSDLKYNKVTFDDFYLEVKPRTHKTLGWPDRLFDESIEIKFGLSLSFKCHPASKKSTTTLKKMFQEHKVPSWLRSSIPLIFFNGAFVGIPDLWIEKDFADEPSSWSVLCSKKIF